MYRLFAEDGTLLYVGSAYKPRERCTVHRRKPWWPEVARREDEWFPNRWKAYEAEKVAIAEEGPKYNAMGTEAYREECRRRAQEDPVRRACIMAGNATARGEAPEAIQAILDLRAEYVGGKVVFLNQPA